MTDDDIRRRHEDIVRRFIMARGGSDERHAIWAEDAVFELPIQERVFRGREAIMARGREGEGKYRDFRLTDLVVYPMHDPNLFLVTHGSEAVLAATGDIERKRYASIFELRDGRIIRRIEFY